MSRTKAILRLETLDTLSKIGLVLTGAGISWIASHGPDWPGLVVVGVGVILAFGPDLSAIIARKWHRRRELSERVVGWEAGIVHAEDVSKLLLTLTPPASEQIDPSIGCAVGLADDVFVAEASVFIPGGGVQSNIRPPKSVKSHGRWNDYYYAFFPDAFSFGFARLGPLSPGEYIVTWSRENAFGRQTLCRSTFKIDRHGVFSSSEGITRT